MTVLTKLGLYLILIAPIICGLFYTKSPDLPPLYVILLFLMGFCGVFSALLHYMLPKKRGVEEEEEQVDGGVVRDCGSGSGSLVKKSKIGFVISSSRTATSGGGEVEVSGGGGEGGGSGSGSGVEGSVNNMGLSDGNNNNQEIDEDLHSRQLAVYGRETMRRLFASNILVSGMQGLGAEIGMGFNIHCI